MKIGIIGTGNMGRALGLRWARAGHQVLFGSRDQGKADAVAAEAGGGAEAGTFDDAAAFGDAVLYTVRTVPPSKLLRAPEALSGKIVIDCNNSGVFGFDEPDPDNRQGVHFPVPVPSLAERLAANIPQARVVKAFNTLPHSVIALDRERLEPHAVSVFLCSDDEAAKATVKALAEDLGFVGVDSGALERAQLVEGTADFIRFLILGMNLGALATISIRVLPEAG